MSTGLHCGNRDSWLVAWFELSTERFVVFRLFVVENCPANNPSSNLTSWVAHIQASPSLV
jgi:hypothetical protein